MARTEYFDENEMQPRDQIPVNTMRKLYTVTHFRGTHKTIHNHA